MDRFAEVLKPDCLVGCVSAGDRFALHDISSSRGLALVAPVGEVAVDETDVSPKEIGTEGRVGDEKNESKKINFWPILTRPLVIKKG